MNAHTVSVTLDDATTSVDAVVQALAKAGYAVPDYQQVAQTD